MGTNSISGKTRVQNCDLVRCGGYEHTYEYRAAFRLYLENHPVAGLELDHLNILDSLSDGLSVIPTGKLSRATLRGLNLPNYGVAATGRHGLWVRSDANGVLTVSDSAVVEHKNDSPGFTLDGDTAFGSNHRDAITAESQDHLWGRLGKVNSEGHEGAKPREGACNLDFASIVSCVGQPWFRTGPIYGLTLFRRPAAPESDL